MALKATDTPADRPDASPLSSRISTRSLEAAFRRPDQISTHNSTPKNRN